MKLGAAILLVAVILTGCSKEDLQIKQTTDLRNRILSANCCCFEAAITANYGDVIYTFQMDCEADREGNIAFTVSDPETIAGITGKISKEKAALTYDDKILAFPILADDQLTPVSAPWIFYNALKSGYITGCSKREDEFCIYIDDSYEENPIHLEIYTDLQLQPIFADFFWNQQRVLSIDIQNFSIE